MDERSGEQKQMAKHWGGICPLSNGWSDVLSHECIISNEIKSHAVYRKEKDFNRYISYFLTIPKKIGFNN